MQNYKIIKMLILAYKKLSMLSRISKSIFIRNIKYKNPSKIIKDNLIHKNIFTFFNENRHGQYDLKKDYYAILGLTKDANQSQIKKQYYTMAKQYHPDVSKDPKNQKFKLLSQAYRVLSDEKLKAQYDQMKMAYDTQQKFTRKNVYKKQNQQQSPYQDQFYQTYQPPYRKYQQMSQQERAAVRKAFSRKMIRVFLFGLSISLFFSAIFGATSKTLVDQYGRRVDANGRPIDRHGRHIMAQPVYNQQNYDPYNLGGSYQPLQNSYGQQYTSGANPNQQNYY